MDTQTTLQQGIAAAKAGRRAEARRLFIEVVKADKTQVAAWQWLKQVVEQTKDKEVCLENILKLELANQAALKELRQLKAPPPAASRPRYLDGEAAKVEDDSLEAAPPPINDEFSNEWLCPYCTALTQPKQTRCPKCHRRLVVTKPVSDRASTWLWRGIFLQFTLLVFLTLFGLGVFILANRSRGVTNPWAFLPVYVGLPVKPAETARIVLRAVPRATFWNFSGLMVYVLGMLAVLYGRVRFGNFLYLFNALVTLSLAFGSAYYYYLYANFLIVLLFSAIVFLFGLAQFAVALYTWHEFNYQTIRLRLKMDSGVKHHTSFYLSGRKYGERGMWGAAIIHFRRAVVEQPENLAYRLALIVAYIKAARYALAQKELAEARKIAPNSSDVDRLSRQVAALKQR